MTSSKRIMGAAFVNHGITTAVGWTIAVGILAINASDVYNFTSSEVAGRSWVMVLLIVTVLLYISFVLYLIIGPDRYALNPAHLFALRNCPCTRCLQAPVRGSRGMCGGLGLGGGRVNGCGPLQLAAKCFVAVEHVLRRVLECAACCCLLEDLPASPACCWPAQKPTGLLGDVFQGDVKLCLRTRYSKPCHFTFGHAAVCSLVVCDTDGARLSTCSIVETSCWSV